jgi:hypothetical protein
VVLVHKLVHGAQKDSVLPPAAEQQRHALTLARRPDTVETRRHPSVGQDLRRTAPGGVRTAYVRTAHTIGNLCERMGSLP